MKRFLRAIGDFVFFRFDLERKSILAALVWAAWVLTRQSFDSGPAFRFLNTSARWLGLDGETLWGGMLLVGGLAQLAGLIWHKRRVRMASAMGLSAVWLGICIAFWLYNPRGPGAASYLIFAWSAGVLYFQIGTGRR